MGLSGFRRRIVALAVAIATLAVGLLVIVSYAWLTKVTEADANTLARTRAEAISANVTLKHGVVALTESGSEAMDAVAWVYADGRLIDGTVPVEVESRVRELATSTRVVTGQAAGFLLYAEPVPIEGHRVVVVVRVDLAPFEASEQNGLTLSLALGAIAIVIAGVLAWFVARSAMGVVRRMAALADEWSAQDPDRRFDLGEPRDEFAELGRTLDHLLDRVQTALEGERRLTDEIAHELRTPMTVLKGEAQLSAMTAGQLAPEIALRELNRMDTAVTTILASARQRLHGGDGCDVATVAAQTIAGRDIDLATSGSAVASVQANVVQGILSPLLDNALRHASTRVWVTVRSDEVGVVASVFDDGPGFAAADVEWVFEPGRTGGSGHGLGLALVRRIARSAEVQVRAVAEGRGHVEVTFPTTKSAS